MRERMESSCTKGYINSLAVSNSIRKNVDDNDDVGIVGRPKCCSFEKTRRYREMTIIMSMSM